MPAMAAIGLGARHETAYPASDHSSSSFARCIANGCVREREQHLVGLVERRAIDVLVLADLAQEFVADPARGES